MTYGQTILILHGWGSSSKNWLKIKEILEEKGCEVFAPDLPGFGNNQSVSRPWVIDDYVKWVKDYSEQQNLSRFFLLGHSFGGGISVKFANAFPDKVQGLILVASAVKRRRTASYYIAFALAKAGNLIFSLPVLSFFQPLAKKVLYFLVGTGDYYKLDLSKMETMKKTFRNVVDEDLISELPKIKTPALIIWGDKDKITPLKDAYLIKEGIKDSKLEIINGGRHALNIQMPEILAGKILNFIISIK